jgi:hypothetical protein
MALFFVSVHVHKTVCHLYNSEYYDTRVYVYVHAKMRRLQILFPVTANVQRNCKTSTSCY